MNLAQLFVTLGVRGGKETVGALGKVRTLLKDSQSNALLLKGSILGAFYGIQRMFSGSNQAGTALVNLSEATGIAIKNLQQYQWAAKEVGLSNEDMANTFMKLKSVASSIATGTGAAPAGLGALLGLTGQDVDMFEFAKDPEKFFKTIIDAVQMAQTTGQMDKSMVDQYLNNLGISTTMASGIRRGIFDQANLDRAPVQSDAQIKALDRARLGWDRLMELVERSIGNINAKFGPSVVANITKLVGSVASLVDAFLKLSEATNAIGILKMIVDGWVEIIRMLTGTTDYVKDGALAVQGDEDAAKRFNASSAVGVRGLSDFILGVSMAANENIDKTLKHVFSRDTLTGKNHGLGNYQNTVNQYFTIQGNPNETKTYHDAARDGVKKAYQQFGNAAIGGQ